MEPISLEAIATRDPGFFDTLSDLERVAALILVGELPPLPPAPVAPPVPRRSPGRFVPVRERDLRRAAALARELATLLGRAL